jgi:hypothetical protein
LEENVPEGGKKQICKGASNPSVGRRSGSRGRLRQWKGGERGSGVEELLV